eukprot:jgi/Botrbrau1/23133/Bobra.0243s0063.1
MHLLVRTSTCIIQPMLFWNICGTRWNMSEWTLLVWLHGHHGVASYENTLLFNLTPPKVLGGGGGAGGGIGCKRGRRAVSCKDVTMGARDSDHPFETGTCGSNHTSTAVHEVVPGKQGLVAHMDLESFVFGTVSTLPALIVQ